MKILFLTYDLPYPLNTGGKIRAYYLIKNLAKSNQITLFSYYRSEEQKKYQGELKKYCQKVYLFKRWPVWFWQNFYQTLRLPFAAALYHSLELEKELTRELAENTYDLVHFESFYPALYLPLVKKMGFKAVMGNENLEYLVYQRYVKLKPAILKWFLNLEVKRLRLFEEKLWRLADLNLAPSANDSQMIAKVTGKTCLTIANGVDVKLYKLVDYHQNRKMMMYLGTLAYQANSDAVRFFLEKVYPAIKKQVNGVKFVLVSGYEPEWLGRYLTDASINYVKDSSSLAAELFLRADVLVVPIRIASGTNIKILEAMAAGLPVVTTSIGAEGLEVKNGENILISDQPSEIAKTVAGLLQDGSWREKIGRQARKLVEKRYDWLKTTERLIPVYHELSDA